MDRDLDLLLDLAGDPDPDREPLLDLLLDLDPAGEPVLDLADPDLDLPEAEPDLDRDLLESESSFSESPTKCLSLLLLPMIGDF